MTSPLPTPPDWVRKRLAAGLVIPAHPLALTSAGRLDERRQRALTRYYHAAGAGGVAVGVHTQFAIREPRHGLLRPVLQLASETVSACDAATGRQTVRIAGICGTTAQSGGRGRVCPRAGGTTPAWCLLAPCVTGPRIKCWNIAASWDGSCQSSDSTSRRRWADAHCPVISGPAFQRCPASLGSRLPRSIVIRRSMSCRVSPIPAAPRRRALHGQ